MIQYNIKQDRYLYMQEKGKFLITTMTVTNSTDYNSATANVYKLFMTIDNVFNTKFELECLNGNMCIDTTIFKLSENIIFEIMEYIFKREQNYRVE